MAKDKTTPPTEPELAETLADQVEAAEPDPNAKIKKKDVYDHVTVATGLRKREVREAVDATLAYLHTCLSDGRDLQLPPLGKVRVIERGKGAKANTHYKLVLQKPKEDDGSDPEPGSAEAAE